MKKIFFPLLVFVLLSVPVLSLSAQNEVKADQKLEKILIEAMKSNTLEETISTVLNDYSLDTLIYTMNEIEEKAKKPADAEILGYTLKEVDHRAVAKSALYKGNELINVYVAYAKQKGDVKTSDILLGSGVDPKFVVRTMRELCIPNIDEIGKEIGISIADVAAGKVMAQDVECSEELGYSFVAASKVNINYQEKTPPASPHKF